MSPSDPADDEPEFDPSAHTLDGAAPAPPEVDPNAATFAQDVPPAPLPPAVDRNAATFAGGMAPLPPAVDRNAATFAGGMAPLPPAVDRDAATFAGGAAPLPPGVDRNAATLMGAGMEPPMTHFDPAAQTLHVPPPDPNAALDRSGPIPHSPESTFSDGFDSSGPHANVFDSRDSRFQSQPGAWSLSGSQAESQATPAPPTPGVPKTERFPPPSASQAGGSTRTDEATRVEPSQATDGAVGPGDTHVEPRTHIDGGSELVQSQATIAKGKPGSAIPSRLGPYRLLRALGAGGMGAVYEAMHLRTERKIALKVLRAPPGADTGVQRFLIEGRAAGRLAHPNLVSVLDLAQDERSQLWYMAMELVEGETLHQLVDREGPVSNQRAAELGKALADALAYAHDEKVLHRDVKPHNVMLDESGTLRLTDFGLAKLLEEPGQALTQGFTLLGTPGYMPPEQAGMAAPVDTRADVYGAGATLYYALTGRSPFTGKTVGSVIHQVLSKNPPPLRKLRAEIDEDLETIVLHCLEKQVEHRYPSMHALAEDLQRYLASTRIVAKRPSAPEQLRRWAVLNPKPALLSALAIVAVLMGATYGGLAFMTHTKRQRDLANETAKLEAEREKVETERDKVDTERDKVDTEREELTTDLEELDKIAPKLELLAPAQPEGQPLRTREATLPVEVRAQDVDVASVTFQGKPLSPVEGDPGVYRGSWELTGEGLKEAKVEATDEAGNVTTQVASVIRDVTSPTLELVLLPTANVPGDIDAVTELTAKLTVGGEDHPVAPPTLFKRDQELGAPTQDPTNPHVWTWPGIELGATGTYAFTATAADDVGNESTVESSVTRKRVKVVETTWWSPRDSQKQFAIANNLPLTKEIEGIKFVLIPPGVYSRGADESDPHSKSSDSDARPHVVKITRGFYLSAWEISQEQFQRVISGYSPPDYTPSHGRAGLESPPTLSLGSLKWPAVGVSRDQASAFCEDLADDGEFAGRFRLPSEAEWEYACRAETTTPWFWGLATYKAAQHGNVMDDDYKAAYAPKLQGPGKEYFNCNDGYELLAPIEREGVEPNPFGLYDTLGNAAEWVLDYLSSYPRDRTTELTDPLETEGDSRRPRWIARGGSFSTPLVWTRATSRKAKKLPVREGVMPLGHVDVGFRVLLELPD